MTKSKAHKARGLAIFILLTLLLALFLSIDIYKISGNSMEPTLPDNSRVLVESVSVTLSSKLKRNSLVQYYHEEKVIKRCVGVPGDTITIDGETVTIYNKTYHITRSVSEELRQYSTIPVGYYFFVGDNLSESTDSRHYGLVPEEAICGRVWRGLS